MKILLISLMLFSGINENIIVINNDTSPVKITKYIEYFEDTSNAGIDNIQGNDIKWQRSGKNTLNFGFTHSVYWFRFTVENNSDSDLLLDINNTTLNSIEFYLPSGKEAGYTVRHAGDKYPFYHRQIKDKNFVFLIPRRSGRQVYYLRMSTTYTFVLSPEIFMVKDVIERDNRSIPGFWLYYGIMAALLLYNLFIFISLREKVYLSLMTIIASWLLSQFAANGYGFMYLWPDSPRIQHSAHAFATTMIGLGIGTYIQQLLETRKNFRVIHRLIWVYMIMFMFIAVAAIFTGEWATRYTTLCMLYATPVSFISVTYAMAKGNRPARFLFIAYSVDFVTKVLTALSLHGVVDNYFLTVWGIKVGSAWFAIMLSLALADRINTFRLSLIESNRKLEISEETYRSIFNGTGEGIFIIDIDSEKIIDANHTGCSMFMADHEEITGRTLEEFALPDRAMLKSFPGLQRFSRGNAAPFEWEFKRNTDTTFWVEISANPVVIRGEKRLMAVVRDISERRRFENEREQMQQQLIHSQKMESVGTLAGGIAHDFNNILAGILGGSSMLEIYAEKKQFDEPVVKKYISMIKASSLRATDMIRQLLTFTRKDELAAVPVDLNEIISHVVQICENSFPKSVEINTSHHDGPAIVRGERGSFEQVLLNLCVNASHAMTIMRGKNEHEGGVLSIGIDEITADRKFHVLHRESIEGKMYYALNVNDTGVGILDNKIS